MIAFLTSFGAKAWAYVGAAFAVVAALFVAFGKAKQAGRTEVTNKVNEATADATAKMLDAAIQSPKTGEGASDAARKGKF